MKTAFFLAVALAPAAHAVPIKSVAMVAIGVDHTCAVLSTGELKCWGSNDFGQLGLGDTVDRGGDPESMGDNLPAIDLGAGRVVKQISLGFSHSCALLQDGAVKCWGYNGGGELGLGDANHRGDAPGEMGDQLPPVDLGAGRKATAIAAGAFNTCAILEDGALKCWGLNEGNLGLGDYRARGASPGTMGDNLPAVALGTGRSVIAITGAQYHSCAVLDDATVKCWGSNFFGELGTGSIIWNGHSPNQMGDLLPSVDLGPGRLARTVSAGIFNSCALFADSTVKCWGMNNDGELGVGDVVSRGFKAADLGDALPPVDLGGVHVESLASGSRHTCALLETGSVKCWGLNSSGALGLGDLLARGAAAADMGANLPAVFLGLKAQAIAAHSDHTCAILVNGGLKCWGSNTYGELGTGDAVDRGGNPSDMATLPFVRLWD